MGAQNQCFGGVQNGLPSIWQLVTSAGTRLRFTDEVMIFENHHLQPYNQGQTPMCPAGPNIRSEAYVHQP